MPVWEAGSEARIDATARLQRILPGPGDALADTACPPARKRVELSSKNKIIYREET